MSDERKKLLKHFNEITKEYHQHCEWTNDKYSAAEQIRQIIQQKPEIDAEPGGLKPGEYMHEWIEKDAVNFDLPTEEIIEALCRDNRLLKKKLDQKPEIDGMEKYVEEKAEELYGETLLAFPRIKQKAHWIVVIAQIVSDVKGRGK